MATEEDLTIKETLTKLEANQLEVADSKTKLRKELDQILDGNSDQEAIELHSILHQLLKTLKCLKRR